MIPDSPHVRSACTASEFEQTLQSALVHWVTPLDWIRGTTTCFVGADLYFGQGWDSAWDEACFLVQTLLHLQPEELLQAKQAVLLPEERQRIAGAVRERVVERKPLAYILRVAPFGPLYCYVDERVLIPRSPFAEWIDRRFSPFWSSESDPRTILDMCTGSGCIALYLAQVFPESTVTAVDCDADALCVAHHNTGLQDLCDRVLLVQSDIWSAFPLEERNRTWQPWDLVVANPPYVPEGEAAVVPPEFAHEPALALYAPEAGLQHIEAILTGAADRILSTGLLCIEMGQTAESFCNRYPAEQYGYFLMECAQGGDGLFAFPGHTLYQYKMPV